MNVNKCTYSIFSGSSNTKKNFTFNLNKQNIKHEKNPKLLGIIFDEKLCFDNHVEKIREKCLKRLNIIKIISHKSWKLTERTKTNIYRALIGSIIDYSFFTESCLSDSVLNRLQTIQNRAIRIISLLTIVVTT